MQTPKSIEPVSEFEISCPTLASIYDYLMCDILLSSGTNLNTQIDYGDASNQTFNAIGILDFLFHM